MSQTDFKLVAVLRKTTGAALHKCKQALEEAKGNVDSAVELIKRMGYSIADKKADRATSEGCIVGLTDLVEGGIARGGLLECRCETDFVSTNEAFVAFIKQVVAAGLKAGAKTLQELLALPIDGYESIEEARKVLIAKVGENIQVARYQLIETVNEVGLYIHKGRYGCVVALKGSKEVAKDMAVHIVVSQPTALAELMEQDFYKDSSKKVKDYLSENQASLMEYVYFVLGRA